MIKTGGENVASRRRSPLSGGGGGGRGRSRPSPLGGSGRGGAIKLRAGATATEEEIMAHCKKHLSSFEVPKKIIFVEALPKTPTGQVPQAPDEGVLQGNFG